MSNKIIKNSSKYSGVDHDFLSACLHLVSKRKNGTVNYFDSENSISGCSGELLSVSESKGILSIQIDGNTKQEVRLDRIITILGKPGPAYDDYDRYANVCFTCEDLGQF